MTVSDTDFYINEVNPYQGHDWIYWRRLMAMLPPDSYAEIKNWILNECIQDGTCTQNTKERMLKKIKNFEGHWNGLKTQEI